MLPKLLQKWGINFKNRILLLIFATKTAAEMGQRTFKIKKFFFNFCSQNCCKNGGKAHQKQSPFTNFCKKILPPSLLPKLLQKWRNTLTKVGFVLQIFAPKTAAEMWKGTYKSRNFLLIFDPKLRKWVKYLFSNLLSKLLQKWGKIT